MLYCSCSEATDLFVDSFQNLRLRASSGCSIRQINLTFMNMDYFMSSHYCPMCYCNMYRNHECKLYGVQVTMFLPDVVQYPSMFL